MNEMATSVAPNFFISFVSPPPSPKKIAFFGAKPLPIGSVAKPLPIGSVAKPLPIGSVAKPLPIGSVAKPLHSLSGMVSLPVGSVAKRGALAPPPSPPLSPLQFPTGSCSPLLLFFSRAGGYRPPKTLFFQ